MPKTVSPSEARQFPRHPALKNSFACFNPAQGLVSVLVHNEACGGWSVMLEAEVEPGSLGVSWYPPEDGEKLVPCVVRARHCERKAGYTIVGLEALMIEDADYQAARLAMLAALDCPR